MLVNLNAFIMMKVRIPKKNLPTYLYTSESIFISFFFLYIEACEAIQFSDFVRCKTGVCKWTDQDCVAKGKFPCCVGSCIPKRWVNDTTNEKDCIDGSDENGELYSFLFVHGN